LVSKFCRRLQSFSSTRSCALRLRGFSASSAAPGFAAFRGAHFSPGDRGRRNSGTSTVPLNS
jgi:hypothetical protein